MLVESWRHADSSKTCVEMLGSSEHSVNVDTEHSNTIAAEVFDCIIDSKHNIQFQTNVESEHRKKVQVSDLRSK